MDLPLPLRPRRLLALLTAARARATAATDTADDALPVGVRVDGGDLDPKRIRVCGLEDLAQAAPGVPLDGWQVMVDAVAGRLFPFQDGQPAQPASLQARHAYGGTADVGAGSYDRTLVHEQALADDPYRGDPARGGPGVTFQRAVLADGPPPDPAEGPPPELISTSIAGAFAAAATDWAGAESPAGASYVVAIGDSARYPVDAGDPPDVSVTLPEATRLVVVAAAWRPRVLANGEVAPPEAASYDPSGLRPRLRGSLTVTGAGGASLLLDGLVIEGDVVVGPGALGSLTLSGCTVGGAVRVAEGAPSDPGIVVRLVRSECGPVRFGPAAADLQVADCTIDADAGQAVIGAGVHLSSAGSTIRGAVAVHTLDATSTIFDGRAVVENHQAGCLRYSYVPRGSRVPRRYRCSPSPAADPATRPVYASTDPGSPCYLALASGCPAELAGGGEGGSEMGVHHHLGRPLRVAAAARLLAPYLPVGRELGVRAPVPAADDAGRS